ncbi:MAG TPA: cytochrome c maturation protein CcmE [Acidimicrobiia bacterium]|nr:cytochrome c maturation protein CcmE [Acidimicrobiia bacterium]
MSTPTLASTRKRRAIAAASLCGLAVVAIVVLAVVLSENVEYFRTVSEAVHARRSDGTSRLRMAGAVVPGTIHATADGVRFKVTDGKTIAQVSQRGDPPSLFKDGAPVVCEGHWAKSAVVFESDRILIKHGSDYEPPKVNSKAGKDATS